MGIQSENIKKRILELYPVSDEAMNLLLSSFKRLIIPAKTIIVEGGKINRNVYFIEKGITRSFCLFDGKEVTTWFSLEGGAACSSFSLYRNQAGFEYVETLEEVEAYVISITELNELYKKHIDLANWMRVLQQENFLLLQDTHIARLNQPAIERYREFLKNFPDISNRVNLKYIASFLGITPQSLSRIRKSRSFLT